MKWFLSIFFCLGLGLLYFSYLVQEESLNEIKNELKEIKRALNQPVAYEKKKISETKRIHIRDDLPNLLSEDPFYTKTLPTLLPKDFSPQGIRREALIGKPEHLHPFNPFKDVSHLWSICTLTLADNHFGKYEIYSPHAAIKIEERKKEDGTLEYWVHLREGIFWHPLKEDQFPANVKLSAHFFEKHPLTAYDYKFFYDAVMNPYVSEGKAVSLRPYFDEIEEFKVIDDLTFVVRWKAVEGKVKYAAFSTTVSLLPLPCFVYQYFEDGQKIVEEESDPDIYRKDSIFAQNFSHHFAKNVIPSCGEFVFEKSTEEGIKLKRNPYHFNPTLVDGLHYTFKQSAEGTWQDFKAKSVDLCQLAPTQLPELETFLKSSFYLSQEHKIKELDFVENSYFYVGWNQATPFFNSKNVRLAMTYALDRNRIISQYLNNMGVLTTGPFFRYSPSYDETIAPLAFDPELAKELLEKEGWVDLDGDGIRKKIIDGKKVPFTFTLTYYAKNLSTKSICDYIATALRQIGVQCHPNGLDVADLSRQFEDKSFDAVFFGWANVGTPPEDPKQLWHSNGAKEKGSSNAIGFTNAEVDRIIDELQYEYDQKKRLALYHRFHRIIHEEAPYTFLFSPKRHLLYRDYLHNVFIPRNRPDLVENARVCQPDMRVTWIAEH